MPRRRRKLPPLGAHVSVAGGLVNGVRARRRSSAATAIQIFVKNANQWRGKALADEEAAAFRAAHAASRVGPLVAHASYLINLAATDPLVLARSRDALADELRALRAAGGRRPGASTPARTSGRGEEAGVDAGGRLARRGPRAALPELPGWRPASCSRTPPARAAASAAAWSTWRRSARRGAAPSGVGFCLDTCHAFAAGYAIHEAAGYEDFLAEVEERLGLAAVGCFHLNDSVRPFGSRRDRHAHIGEGEIGLEPFARFLHDPRLREVPMLLETEPGLELEGPPPGPGEAARAAVT